MALSRRPRLKIPKVSSAGGGESSHPPLLPSHCRASSFFMVASLRASFPPIFTNTTASAQQPPRVQLPAARYRHAKPRAQAFRREKQLRLRAAVEKTTNIPNTRFHLSISLSTRAVTSCPSTPRVSTYSNQLRAVHINLTHKTTPQNAFRQPAEKNLDN